MGIFCHADHAACLFANPGIPLPSPPALGNLWLNPVGRTIEEKSYPTVLRYQMKAQRKIGHRQRKISAAMGWEKDLGVLGS